MYLKYHIYTGILYIRQLYIYIFYEFPNLPRNSREFTDTVIRLKNKPHSVILTYVVCTIHEEFLIDDDMIPYHCST